MYKKLRIFIFCIMIFNFYFGLQSSFVKERFLDHIWFNIQPLSQVLTNNPQILYTQVSDKLYFDYPQFSIAPAFPHRGYFNELFILTIPQGKVQGTFGHVFIDSTLPAEMVRADRYDCLIAPQLNSDKFFKIPGKVAVIAQHGAGPYWSNYYHSLYEVFGRLAILEMNKIAYDWLYIPTDKKFVREILELWGIDSDIIIAPPSEYFGIQADELIVPSLVINTSVGHKHAGNFQHPLVMKYVREKLLQKAKEKHIDISHFSKKVFITRKDSYNGRRVSNEDEIFALFEAKGFKRYALCSLSVVEQILLFHNAEIIVSEQGSGLTNILFCNTDTQVVEIFQALIDNCFWWVSQIFKFNYVPIVTLPADVDYFANWWDKGLGHLVESGNSIVAVPLDPIEQYIQTI